jgi:inositol transport system ATP-binding protein
VFRIADEVSVLRDGRMVGSEAVENVDRNRLIAMMVGRELTQLFPKSNVPTDRVVLSVKDLSLNRTFSAVSFDVRAGEILGIAGLVGSRRTEVAETIFGLRRPTSGEIRIDGVPVDIDSPATAIDRGMALMTEDRQMSGLFLPLSVQENMEVTTLAGSFVDKRFINMGFVRQQMLVTACAAMADRLRVKMPNLFEPVRNLSGGNQQKVLIGRWLLTAPRILILDEPTRGIDVGAKADIHRLISGLAADGAAVVMISSELPEILGMSDRVMVMREGRTTGILDRAEANQVDLMRLAAH